MFWFFGRKKEVEKVKEDTKKGFDAVRHDVQNVSQWIKHLDVEKERQQNEISSIVEDIASIKDEIESIKNIISLLGDLKLNKQPHVFKRLSNKQTAVEAVEVGVETAVYTPNLEAFSITERAILWVLLNTDMKLSYEDLAAMLGKERSTIRSQLNHIKRKAPDLVEEMVEKNGKKRVFIPENMKEIMLKKSKVRVNSAKKTSKKHKNE